MEISTGIFEIEIGEVLDENDVFEDDGVMPDPNAPVFEMLYSADEAERLKVKALSIKTQFERLKELEDELAAFKIIAGVDE